MVADTDKRCMQTPHTSRWGPGKLLCKRCAAQPVALQTQPQLAIRFRWAYNGVVEQLVQVAVIFTCMAAAHVVA